MLLRIESEYFTAGVEPGVSAAPIIAYMKNWTEERIRSYCNRKKWMCRKVVSVPSDDVETDWHDECNRAFLEGLDCK